MRIFAVLFYISILELLDVIRFTLGVMFLIPRSCIGCVLKALRRRLLKDPNIIRERNRLGGNRGILILKNLI